jgi:hypothetical protein
MKESRKEFIKQAHSNASSEWKEKIEKEFPELFKEDALVVGKWYKIFRDESDSSNSLVIFKGYKFSTYGFNHSNNWTDTYGSYDTFNNMHYKYTPATDKEVEEAIEKECFKKGYKEGVEVICLKGSVKGIIDKYDIDNPAWEIDVKGGFNLGNKTVMLNGKWAEIIKETITKEQAQEATRILVEYNNQ